MRIGEMSRRTGVNERLLRYYEEQGLITAGRTPGGYRVYRDDDVDTVRRIRSLLAANLSTATIALILPCVREDNSRLIPLCTDLVAQLQHEHDRITGAIEELQASKSLLEHVIEAAPTKLPGSVK